MSLKDFLAPNKTKIIITIIIMIGIFISTNITKETDKYLTFKSLDFIDLQENLQESLENVLPSETIVKENIDKIIILFIQIFLVRFVVWFIVSYIVACLVIKIVKNGKK